MTELKIAVPVNTDKSINTGFGKSFAIVTCNDTQIDETTIYSAATDSQEAIITELKNQNIQALLCKNADYKLLTYLEEQNIPIFRINANSTTIEEAANDHLNHKLAPIVKMFTCGGACDY